ncbi:hypothetical protein BH23ACT9_BH23ACT9_03390 [soil metagenome]
MIDSALPVALDLCDADLAEDVTAHVESVLGWQVVRPGPHLPVRLLLADRVDQDLPTVVVVRAADGTAVREAMRAGALDVIVWPADAHRLADLRPTATPMRPAGRLLAVCAAASGVGASTVALTLGALTAWSGHRTVVVTDAPGRRLAGLSGAGLQDVAGVEHLSVAPDVATSAAAGIPDVLVADVGAGRRGQVLVGRADRALALALDHRSDVNAVVAVGTGALRPPELRRLVGGRVLVSVDWSFRVSRAGLTGRVPVGLPGRHLKSLRPVLDALPMSSREAPDAVGAAR